MAVSAKVVSGSAGEQIVRGVGQISAVIIAIAYLVICIAILAAVIAVTGRMFGMPMVMVQLQTGDLIPVGVFLFCAAFALK